MSDAVRRRVVLFSGMGADHRLFGELELANAELVAPDHVMPESGESLAEYALRVGELQRIAPADVVGGASFGGMLAAELAARRPVAGLILLGSAPAPQHLPAGVKWLERISRLAPDRVLDARLHGALMRWRFGPMSPAQADLLAEMGRACPTEMVRRFAAMIASWTGAAAPGCPTLIVHGAEDRVIPLGAIPADVVVPNAGHALQLTHPAELSRAIDAFLARLPRQPRAPSSSPAT